MTTLKNKLLQGNLPGIQILLQTLKSVTADVHQKPVGSDIIAEQMRWSLRLHLCHWWYSQQLAALSSTFRTWLPSRGLQQKVTLQRAYQPNCCGAQPEKSFPECRLMPGPPAQWPNQTQIAGEMLHYDVIRSWSLPFLWLLHKISTAFGHVMCLDNVLRNCKLRISK